MSEMHEHRQPKKRQGPPTQPREYTPGWFTEPVLAWWPNWQPYAETRKPGDPLASHHAMLSRRRAQESGVGWGRGTVQLPKTPQHDAPGWMGR
jgi:hypothetical protein